MPLAVLVRGFLGEVFGSEGSWFPESRVFHVEHLHGSGCSRGSPRDRVPRGTLGSQIGPAQAEGWHLFTAGIRQKEGMLDHAGNTGEDVPHQWCTSQAYARDMQGPEPLRASLRLVRQLLAFPFRLDSTHPGDEMTEPSGASDPTAFEEPAVNAAVLGSTDDSTGGFLSGEGDPSSVEQISPKPPRIIALANQKGGVGKTTTTVNLGASLADLNHRVLVVDLDPQGNATTGLGINKQVLDETMYDVLLNKLPIDDCIEPTEVRGLFVAPASLDLAGSEIELVSAFSREGKLKIALKEVENEYDFILIDCPPSLGLLTVNALVAATEVMVPIQCEYYALEGLAQLSRNVALVSENLNPGLEIASIVMVMYDSRTKLAAQVVGEVRSHFGDRVCKNMIPRNIKLSEAPSYGQPVTIYDPSSRGSVAYRELAREVSNGV